MELSDDDLTFKVIGCFRWVYNEHGFGLLESAYKGALLYACTKRGLRVEQEVGVPFYFDGVVVANYRMDLVIERRLIVELKSVESIHPQHIRQVLHYLRATDFELGLLLNFGPKPLIKRFTLRNALKERRDPELAEHLERSRIEGA